MRSLSGWRLGRARRDQNAIVRQSMVPLVTGIATGLGGWIALGRLIKSLLFQVPASDPLTPAAAVRHPAYFAGSFMAARVSRYGRGVHGSLAVSLKFGAVAYRAKTRQQHVFD